MHLLTELSKLERFSKLSVKPKVRKLKYKNEEYSI
jgi:hypothetical protein